MPARPIDRQAGDCAEQKQSRSYFKAAFSLIELIIVIVILGALTAIIIPMFTYSESNAKADAVTAEMAAIQSAWTEFYNDCFPTENDLKILASYGLHVLCSSNAPSGFSGTWPLRTGYDPYNELGWNGPYLMSEDTLEVDASTAGQEEQSGGTSIPIVNDPYTGHYRILRSVSNKFSLICTGRNRTLESSTNAVDSAGWILDQQGDDTALPLPPF